MNQIFDDVVPGKNDPLSLKSSGTKRKALYFMSKRLFDLVISFASLPVFVVLCLVVMVINRKWNQGPLFYVQKRMGKDQRPFRMIKFRTMLPEDSAAERGAFDGLEEWRITPFGKWMRKTRLDEVPQILNIIAGQMSLIGPRPEVVQFAEAYQKAVVGYHVRETVRPGITGFAQVTQGYTDTEEAIRTKTKLDTFYVRNMGWGLDLIVLIRTVRVVLTSSGAR